MKYSVWLAPSRCWKDVRQIVRHCEMLGFTGIWCADHFVPVDDAIDDARVWESWAMLGALSEFCQQIEIGSLVSSVTYRHPVVLAAAALTCHQVSGGRFVLGLGSGWHEREHESFGFELGSKKTRSDRLEAAATVVRQLLHGEVVSQAVGEMRFNDASLSIADVESVPALLIGGKGQMRTLRTASRLADKWNSWADPETFVDRHNVLEHYCSEIGRDVRDIECSTQLFLCLEAGSRPYEIGVHRYGSRPLLLGNNERCVETLSEFHKVGLDEIIIPDWNYQDPVELCDALEKFMTEIACEI